MTSTEGYPHLYPSYGRKGFIYDDVMVRLHLHYSKHLSILLNLYLEQLSILNNFLSWTTFYLEQFTFLNNPLSWTTFYLEHPSILNIPLSWTTLYLEQFTILNIPLSWTILYLEQFSILNIPLSWTTLYLEQPSILNISLSWTIHYLEQPSILNNSLSWTTVLQVYYFTLDSRTNSNKFYKVDALLYGHLLYIFSKKINKKKKFYNKLYWKASFLIRDS